MNISTSPVGLSQVADCLRGSPDQRDPSGYHVTDLYWSAQQIAKGKDKPDYSEMEGLAQMGFIWEYAVRPWISLKFAYPDNIAVFSPVFELDGVKASLDALIYRLSPDAPPNPLVIDAKLKFGKLKPVEDYPHWMWQLKAYCKMTQATEAALVVLNILERPPRCVASRHTIQFTQVEIEENWSSLINTKRHLEMGSAAPDTVAVITGMGSSVCPQCKKLYATSRIDPYGAPRCPHCGWLLI